MERSSGPAIAVRDECRQAAKQRDDRKTEEKQGWDDGHQQEVLDHVGAEQRIGECIERRADGEPECGEAGEKRQRVAIEVNCAGVFCAGRSSRGGRSTAVSENREGETDGRRPIGHTDWHYGSANWALRAMR